MGLIKSPTIIYQQNVMEKAEKVIKEKGRIAFEEEAQNSAEPIEANSPPTTLES